MKDESSDENEIFGNFIEDLKAQMKTKFKNRTCVKK